MSVNSIILEGNLTKDPLKKETAAGVSVCTFSIGANRYYKRDEETEKEVSFFDIETWSKLAEICGEHLEKGRGVRIVGRLKQDRWEDSDGQLHSRIKIIADHVEFKPKKQNIEGITEKDLLAV